MAEITLADTSQKTRDIFNRGFAAFERGNLDYAIDLLTTCLDVEPRLLQARKFLRAAEVQKRKKTGRSAISRAIVRLKTLPSYLGTAHLVRSQKADKALQSAEKLLREDPLEPAFALLFATAAILSDLPEAAVQTLEIVRDHQPENANIVRRLAEAYQAMGAMRKARESYERLIELKPDNPDDVKALKDSLALDSMSTDGWSKAAVDGGTFREMIRDETEAVLLEQESKAVKSDKDASDLIASAREKIEADPNDINAYRALARLCVQAKMFEDALAALDGARARSPGDPELDQFAGAVRLQMLEHEAEALREAGNEDGAREKELERAAFVLADLKERVQRYPNDLRLRYEYGRALYEDEQINKAIQQFQASQRSPKQRILSLYYLALCFRHKKQYDLATEQLEAAGTEIAVMDENKKAILYELGDICSLMGQDEKAAEYFKRIYQVDIGYRDVAERVERDYA